MNQTMQSINGKATELQNEFDNAEKRKLKWNSEKKQLLSEVLNGVIKSTNTLKATVSEGVEFVSLTLNPQKAVNYPEQARTSGSLFYTLTHRGKVNAIVVFPWVNGQVEKLPAQVIGNESIEPSELTSEVILSHVEHFLDEMLRWETNKTAPLGFQLEAGKISKIIEQQND